MTGTSPCIVDDRRAAPAPSESATDPSRDLAAEYSAKASAYATHWAPVIGPMALPVLARLPLAQAGCILDVGVGTGELVPALRAAAPAARIIGIDRSEGMLRIAGRIEGLERAVMDAQQLALRSQVFDVALLAFVLFHLPQPEQALREAHRVLQRGGAIGLGTWGDDPGVPGAAVWAEALSAAGAAPDPRAASVMQHARMDTPQKLAELLRQAGFHRERAWCQRFTYRWTVRPLMALQVTCGSAGRRLASLAPSVRAACVRRVRERLSRLRPEELVYRPEIVFAVARAPA